MKPHLKVCFLTKYARHMQYTQSCKFVESICVFKFPVYTKNIANYRHLSLDSIVILSNHFLKSVLIKCATLPKCAFIEYDTPRSNAM